MGKPRKPVPDPEEADTESPRSYSSPACYMHELDESCGVTGSTSMKSWGEVRDWRKRTRESLIASRLALTVSARLAKGERAKANMLASVDLKQYSILGIYWPMRGEIDVRDIAGRHIAAGGMVGLPVVIEKAAPVEFWKWQPGMRMERGVWNIPVPTAREELIPDALVIPLVGFDSGRYRLGYGGGYYDRTIAALSPRPFRVGLGYLEAELATIFPQPHDIPMDVIITDR
jgi:5,10-methenyltetrahydrofolate synthetase